MSIHHLSFVISWISFKNSYFIHHIPFKSFILNLYHWKCLNSCKFMFIFKYLHQISNVKIVIHGHRKFPANNKRSWTSILYYFFFFLAKLRSLPFHTCRIALSFAYREKKTHATHLQKRVVFFFLRNDSVNFLFHSSFKEKWFFSSSSILCASSYDLRRLKFKTR